VSSITGFLLDLLELVGVVAALVVLLVVLATGLRAVWQVRRKSLLVLPFRGSDQSQHVAGVLAQRLVAVEREWIALSSEVGGREESLKGGGGEAVAGPATRTLSDALAWFDPDQGTWILKAPDGESAREPREVIAEQPLDPDAVGSVTLAGVAVSMGVLLTLMYRLRAAAAPERIAGTLYVLGSTARLDGSLRTAGQTQNLVCVRELKRPDELFDVIDDFAFDLLKHRLSSSAPGEDFGTDALTWKGYRSFLAAHDSHLRFLMSGRAFDREDAIEGYEAAIGAEPAYWLPHYNLGTLLYNRYTQVDNARAIELFRAAAQSRASRLRALSLAGLTMAYCQNVHRFGKPREPWAFWADVESARALEYERDLAETRFARGWACQVLGRMEEALEWYEGVAQVPEDTAKIRQLKSFALTNAGYVCLTYLDDESRAEDYLREALRLYRNKITHANLGEIHKRRREFEAAKREFESAVSLDPRYVNGLNEFGMLYVAWAREAAGDGKPSELRGSPQPGPAAKALLEQARTWHERALTVLDDPDARAQLHESFGGELRRWGFEREARRELKEAQAARRGAAAPADSEEAAKRSSASE
jgi:tetratricopeptide (TPR) repeat protein